MYPQSGDLQPQRQQLARTAHVTRGGPRVATVALPLLQRARHVAVTRHRQLPGRGVGVPRRPLVPRLRSRPLGPSGVPAATASLPPLRHPLSPGMPGPSPHVPARGLAAGGLTVSEPHRLPAVVADGRVPSASQLLPAGFSLRTGFAGPWWCKGSGAFEGSILCEMVRGSSSKVVRQYSKLEGAELVANDSGVGNCEEFDWLVSTQERDRLQCSMLTHCQPLEGKIVVVTDIEQQD